VPRALIVEWSTVADEDRGAILARWHAQRAGLEADGAHCWVYESATARGRFAIFTEAKDAATLRDARARHGFARSDDILHEVELR
jgi:hypothetical protein